MTAVASIAILLGAIVCVVNWSAFFATSIGRRYVSPVPIVGGLLLLLGLLGFESTRRFAALGLLADWGTLALLLSLPTMVREARATSRRNLIRSFSAVSGGRKYEIRLFKDAVFTITVQGDPGVLCNHHGYAHVRRGFTGTWGEKPTEFVLEGYAGSRCLMIKKLAGPLQTVELNYTAEGECSWDSLQSLILTPTPP